MHGSDHPARDVRHPPHCKGPDRTFFQFSLCRQSGRRRGWSADSAFVHRSFWISRHVAHWNCFESGGRSRRCSAFSCFRTQHDRRKCRSCGACFIGSGLDQRHTVFIISHRPYNHGNGSRLDSAVHSDRWSDGLFVRNDSGVLPVRHFCWISRLSFLEPQALRGRRDDLDSAFVARNPSSADHRFALFDAHRFTCVRRGDAVFLCDRLSYPDACGPLVAGRSGPGWKSLRGQRTRMHFGPVNRWLFCTAAGRRACCHAALPRAIYGHGDISSRRRETQHTRSRYGLRRGRCRAGSLFPDEGFRNHVSAPRGFAG